MGGWLGSRNLTLKWGADLRELRCSPGLAPGSEPFWGHVACGKCLGIRAHGSPGRGTEVAGASAPAQAAALSPPITHFLSALVTVETLREGKSPPQHHTAFHDELNC